MAKAVPGFLVFVANWSHLLYHVIMFSIVAFYEKSCMSGNIC